MININKVIIENFQSHENTVLEFHNGLNVILGSSDQGKSAVIRAIKWALYNEPRGMDFIRHGTKGAKVIIELSNSYTITRERTQSKNRYILKEPNGEEMVFESFGNEIPLEIINAHKISKFKLDSDLQSSLNLGNQLDGPFLLSETGAVRAKAIGRLTGLHIIDKSIRDTISDIKKETQINTVLNKELSEINEELKNYENLNNIEKNLIETEDFIRRLENLNMKLENLQKVNQAYLFVNSEYKKNLNLLNSFNQLKDFEIILAKLENNLTNLKTFKRIKTEYFYNSSQIKELTSVLVQTEKIDEIDILLNKLINLRDLYTKINSIKQNLKVLDDEIKKIDKIIEITSNIYIYDDIIINVSNKVQKLDCLKKAYQKLNFTNQEMEKIKEICVQKKTLFSYSEMVKQADINLIKLNKLLLISEKNKTLMSSINEGIEYLKNNDIMMEEYLSQYAILLQKHEKCPLCFSEISEDKIDDIIKCYKEV